MIKFFDIQLLLQNIFIIVFFYFETPDIKPGQLKKIQLYSPG